MTLWRSYEREGDKSLWTSPRKDSQYAWDQHEDLNVNREHTLAPWPR